MKKQSLSLLLCFSAALVWSCSDNNNTTAGGADSTAAASSNMTSGSDTMRAANNTPTTSSTATNGAPLSKADSMFVMEAATGGMEEVAMGQLAQQNASSDRVKAFGAMMVRDHSQANNELSSFASSRGLTVPSALPAAKQKDVDNMKKMTGKAFDMHYVSMMVDDHKKDVDKFKKESTSADDADLKNWAGKTLPTLQTHLDSIQAIKNSKM